MQVLRIVPNLASASFTDSRDFYVSMFDLSVSVELDDWYLQLMEATDPTLNIGFVKPDAELLAGNAQPGGVAVTVHVDDVDDAYRRAEDLGAEIVSGIRDEEYGQRHFLVLDPNGVVLNVMSAIEPQPG
jgi:predicted enzyme related to lactoylglutathione lyase